MSSFDELGLKCDYMIGFGMSPKDNELQAYTDATGYVESEPDKVMKEALVIANHIEIIRLFTEPTYSYTIGEMK